MGQNHLEPNPARILLVEDDEVARVSLFQVLTKAGYSVEAVLDGQAACARLEQAGRPAPYDVVISDLILPGADGVQVLKCARQLADSPEVILLTGFGTLQTAIEALRVGAADYLLKPCKPEELLHCIAAACRRKAEQRSQLDAISSIALGLSRLQGRSDSSSGAPPEQRSPQAIVVGPLHIDRQNHSVYFQGQPVVLTPTEYALISCLAESFGKMVSYEELASQVYRQSVNQSDAHVLLKTHIHNLRRKLAPEMIVNVRSVGYRLVAHPLP